MPVYQLYDISGKTMPSFSGNAKAQWGKMNVYQMLKHCALWEDMTFGKIAVKRHVV
jgi:hypothetical protein